MCRLRSQGTYECIYEIFIMCFAIHGHRTLKVPHTVGDHAGILGAVVSLLLFFFFFFLFFFGRSFTKFQVGKTNRLQVEKE